MRIKSLYIRGFKSFMNKCTLQIPPGISAFVGPNGCGKSNIVDAIRWVMGEQSPKQLRGRQMEDLIFSGAGALKPLGMAEVILTLEDTQDLYPTSEVSITRRLYRSNESEYLINNSPCRLKDIQDFLMGTGLGNRSYAIIAQGEISTIIEQRPEDLRRLLEEAAGITKYKLRREAALRKISLTKENLTRVEDLIGEIKRGMNSLHRQAHKAKKFKEASAEIRRLELVARAYAYEELHEEKRKRKKIIDDLLGKERQLELLLSQSEKTIETANYELMEKEQALSDLKESVFSLREECRKNEAALQHLSADQVRLSATAEKLNKEREDISEKLREFQSETAKITSRIEELKESIHEASALRSQHDSLFRDDRILLDALKDELKKEKLQLIELTTEEARLKGEIRNLSETIYQVEARRNSLEEESRDVEKKLESQAVVLDEKRRQREEITGLTSSIEKNLEMEHAKQEELRETGRIRESEMAAAASELNLIRSQLKTIESLIENYEGYDSGVQAVMNAPELNGNKKDKILGVLADFIQVEPEFEVPVEAILAERLQYVIVARQEDGKEAVDYLRSKEKGRSYFLPLEEFKNGKAPERSEVNLNGFKLLSEHISAPEKYGSLVKSLLGDAALVDDLAHALSAWKKGRGQQALVTPEGDLVDERGIIIGGRIGKDSAGLLRRRRRERELRKEIRDKEDYSAALESGREEWGWQLEEVNGVIDRLERERVTNTQHIEKTDRGIFLLEQESEQLIKHSHYVLAQLESLSDDKEKKTGYLTELEERLSVSLEGKEDIQRVVAEKEAKAEALEGALNDSKEHLSQLLIRYNQYKEEERGLLRENERLEQFMGEMEIRAKKIEEEVAVTTNQYQGSLIKAEDAQQQLAVLSEKQRVLENEAHELDQRHQIVKDVLRQEEKKASLGREEIGRIRDEINEAKIREAEIDFQISSILSNAGRESGINLQRDYKTYLDEDLTKEQCEQKLSEYKVMKEKIGEVNLLAINEYDELKQRYEFITSQQQDLLSSVDSLNNAIRRINRISRHKFLTTLGEVDEQLKKVFPILFNGGKARLRLIDESLPLESGLIVEVQPPGKRLVHMALLSGGEKALAAMALLFAIYLIKPSPFIIMDEVDAPLDEANTDRFNDLLKEIKKSSQVIMVSHNRRTMEIAERLYGMVMDRDSVSKVVSVDLSDYR